MSADSQILSPREVFILWSQGCSCAPSAKPWECEPCTVAFISAMGSAFAEHGSASMADLRRELENTQTANHGLRVSLHVMQKSYIAQVAASGSLVQSIQSDKLEHLQALANMQSELERAKGHIRHLENSIRAQADVIGKLAQRVQERKPPAS